MTVSNTEVAQFPGSAAVDGNPTTRWSSGYSDPQWISIDLGSSQSISRLVLKWDLENGLPMQGKPTAQVMRLIAELQKE